MFLTEISRMGSESWRALGDGVEEAVDPNPSLKRWLHGNNKQIASKLIETPVKLSEYSIVEFIYNKKLTFGNYISFKRNSKGLVSSLNIQRVTGEVVSIDVSQIISIWDTVADEEVMSISL